MPYRVEIRREAQKQLLTLPGEARTAIAREIDQLSRTPRSVGCKKLRGTPLRRVRQGRYRVIYAVDDEARLVTVVKVAMRREDTY